MAHLIDISATFKGEAEVLTVGAIEAMLGAMKTSDDEPLMEVVSCSIIPDTSPDYHDDNEVHAVISARSERFDADSIKPWLNKALNDTRESQPTLLSVDLVDAAQAPGTK